MRVENASANVGTAGIMNNNVVTLNGTTPATDTTIVLRFHVVYSDSMGVDHSVLREETILVDDGWFTDVDSSVPANNAAMTDSGIYRSGVSRNTFTGPGTVYIALPTGSMGYLFQTRSGFEISSTVVTGGYSQSGYTLYSLGVLDSGESLTVEVSDG